MRSGFDFEKYYTISSKNKIEIFEINFTKLGYIPLDFIISFDETKFDNEIINLQNSAICILQEQYFIVTEV